MKFSAFRIETASQIDWREVQAGRSPASAPGMGQARLVLALRTATISTSAERTSMTSTR
ncbi:hypothetical protein DFO48_101619 [Comamonas sp. AG1104]|nr:hypothetical protein DFO48_101619 [Comamonas sp. AG1104]